MKNHQGIRDIASEYLNDPDLWIDILQANRLNSPHEVTPGMTLHIPAQKIFEAKNSLDNAMASIRKATQAGARIFAPDTIGKAIELRESAIQKRKKGDWTECANLAKASDVEAQKALSVSLEHQNEPAEAVVQYRQGNVHSRKPSDMVWTDVSKFDILTEGQRIRTLSNSNADILFRDDSVLQMKENAQALIQKMRANRLEETEEAKISLIKGEVFALLAGTSKTKQFNVDISGVETRIDSREFWVGRDDDGTRFANFEGEIEISSGGETVVLKKNEGSVIPLNQKPSAPQHLLTPPQPISPENGAETYDSRILIQWTPVVGSDHYRLEFSRDAVFTMLIRSEKVRGTQHTFPEELGKGVFFWRVMSVSADKLPSPPSPAWFFRIRDDARQPFLVIQFPSDGIVVSEKLIEISGQTENDVDLTIQDQRITIGADGKFHLTWELADGENRIAFKAVAPSGLTTTAVRIVTRMAPGNIPLSYDSSLPITESGCFLTDHYGFTLIGRTLPNAAVSIASPKGYSAASAVSDAQGGFAADFKLTESEESFSVEITSPVGTIRKESITIAVDDKPPVVTFDPELPSITSQETLTVSGMADDAVEMAWNGKAIPLNNGRFATNIGLKNGYNEIRFTARDRVRNTAIIEKRILRDSQPPELMTTQLSPHEVKGGETIQVSVIAKDTSGLSKVGSFSASIGEFTHNGILTLTESSGNYTGSFRVPDSMQGTIKFTSIRLSDYAGNNKLYEFP